MLLCGPDQYWSRLQSYGKGALICCHRKLNKSAGEALLDTAQYHVRPKSETGDSIQTCESVCTCQDGNSSVRLVRIMDTGAMFPILGFSLKQLCVGITGVQQARGLATRSAVLMLKSRAV